VRPRGSFTPAAGSAPGGLLVLRVRVEADHDGNLAVVGDFSNYLIAMRAGMNVELVPTLFDQATGRPSGQRGWFAWARVGGDAIVHAGFRLINQT
jgi:HK97 family phage major capsid protein